MGCYVNADETILHNLRNDFITTIQAINRLIGKNAFRNYNKGKYSIQFNPALYDAVTIAFYRRISLGKQLDMANEERHKALFSNEIFVQACKLRTIDIVNIKKRIELAETILFEK